jgi:hypothetical protein
MSCERTNRDHRRGAEIQSGSFLLRLCASVSLWRKLGCGLALLCLVLFPRSLGPANGITNHTETGTPMVALNSAPVSSAGQPPAPNSSGAAKVPPPGRVLPLKPPVSRAPVDSPAG